MFKKRHNNLQAGLSLIDNRLIVALVKRERDSVALVDASASDPLEGSSLQDQLAKTVKSLQLNKIPCIWAMEPDSYSLLQIESPNVNADEMRAALRWKIKDLIDFHIDDATIDLFEMPDSARSGSSKMLNVVVARTSLVRERVDCLHAVDIEPAAIDITELAMRNIAQHQLDENVFPRGGLFVLPDNVYIEIVDAKQLYLSRNIEFSFAEANTTRVEDNDFRNWNDTSDFELLSLEMQRSMDYYESHYGNGPATQMRIFQCPADDGDFIEYAQRQLPFKIEPVALLDIIPGLDGVDSANMPSYLPAIGAALRVAAV